MAIEICTQTFSTIGKPTAEYISSIVSKPLRGNLYSDVIQTSAKLCQENRILVNVIFYLTNRSIIRMQI